jgi:tetrapyrrole methylase family protein/MazG family protein
MITERTDITIVGLGPGDPNLLTREAWNLLEDIPEIYLRTRQHPTVAGFPKHLRISSFDDYYQDGIPFPEVYQRIVRDVLDLGRRADGVVYAVPGHPLVAEATTSAILNQAEREGLSTRVIAGLSFLEPVFTALQIDPLPKTLILDALDLVSLHHPPFPPDCPALIAQLYSPRVASELKITLMAVYPDEHPVILIHQAGTPEQQVEMLPLYQIDRSKQIGNLTCLYVQPLRTGSSFENFQEIIAHLRAPDGCPWDREQDHQSLRPHLLEEAYEVVYALDQNDPEAMQEEFGDLLLQIVLHAQIAHEYGEFSMVDILEGIYHKIVSRHPHVFSDLDLDGTDQVLKNWEKLKAEERAEKGEDRKGVLDGISPALPALTQAQTIQRRAARVGMDWAEIQGVLEKVSEELEELKKAGEQKEKAHELGDLFFALVNVSRWYGIDAESALREANQRFRARFAEVEEAAREEGKTLEEYSLQELDQLWEQAKRSERPDEYP